MTDTATPSVSPHLLSEEEFNVLDLDSSSAFVRGAGLEVDEVTGSLVRGHIDLTKEHHTPWGIVHGGVYATAIESAASIGATTAVRDRGMVAVGLTNTTHFLRSLTEGRVDIVATALNQGRSQQLWKVDVTTSRVASSPTVSSASRTWRRRPEPPDLDAAPGARLGGHGAHRATRTGRLPAAMSAYGVLPPDEGTGLLPWSWALERLERSHDYWVATVGPEGRPNVTPVWGVLMDGCLWFSCDPSTRKSRNLRERPHVTVTTEDPQSPVIVEGTADLADDRLAVQAFTSTMNDKYEYQSPFEFFWAHDTWRVTPATGFGLEHDDFTGSPTRWRF